MDGGLRIQAAVAQGRGPMAPCWPCHLPAHGGTWAAGRAVIASTPYHRSVTVIQSSGVSYETSNWVSAATSSTEGELLRVDDTVCPVPCVPFIKEHF